mgnify:CR=1 FL=1
MTLLESIWFVITFLIISVVLLIDPKSSAASGGNNPVIGVFSSPSSGQSFIYRVSAVLIILFYILTIVLSYLG